MAIDIKIIEKHMIQAVVDQLHDSWLCVDKIDHDKECENLRLPFLFKNRPSDKFDVWLIVGGVKNFEITDTEMVGYYDLNDITISGNVLVFTFGVPLELKVIVNWL